MRHDSIFFSKKLETYFLSDLSKNCHSCTLKIEKIAFSIREVSRTYDRMRFYCAICGSKREANSMTILFEKKILVVSEIIPKDAIAVFREKLQLQGSRDLDQAFSCSGVSTFDTVEIAKLGGTTVDKTVYAGRELGLALNNPDEVLKLCHEKDVVRNISIDELGEILQSHKEAQILIASDDEKKLLR